MDLLQYVMHIGVVYLIVLYGCKLAIHLPLLFLCSFLGISKRVTYLVNCPIEAFVAYLLVSLTSRLTLIAIAAQSHSSFSVFFIIIGIAVIYLSLANASQAEI